MAGPAGEGGGGTPPTHQSEEPDLGQLGVLALAGSALAGTRLVGLPPTTCLHGRSSGVGTFPPPAAIVAGPAGTRPPNHRSEESDLGRRGVPALAGSAFEGTGLPSLPPTACLHGRAGGVGNRQVVAASGTPPTHPSLRRGARYWSARRDSPRRLCHHRHSPSWPSAHCLPSWPSKRHS
jgi:hypothetical protein